MYLINILIVKRNPQRSVNLSAKLTTYFVLLLIIISNKFYVPVALATIPIITGGIAMIKHPKAATKESI